MTKLITLLALLTSCTATNLNESRTEMSFFEVVNDKTETVFDSKYESIELSEVKQYWFECKEMLYKGGVAYQLDQFDCEDYTRQLMAYIMRNHKYNKTPAICNVIIPSHSLMGFFNNKKEFIMIDARTGRVYKDNYLKRYF